MPFDPAALVAEGDGGDEDVFDCGGVILNEKRAVAVGDDAPREHENHRGGCLADAGVGEGVELFEQDGIVHGDEARRLLVAAGGRGIARLQQLPEVFARDGGGVVFAAVAGAGEDGGEGGHGGLLDLFFELNSILKTQSIFVLYSFASSSLCSHKRTYAHRFEATMLQ